MLAGEFARKLSKLNSKLRVFCGDDDHKPAGIFYVTPQGEYTEVCGIDKNYVPEFTDWDKIGHIKHGGWRRALQVLSSLKLINRRESYKLFGHWDEHRQPPFVREIDSLDKQIQELTANPGMKQNGDLFVDVSRELTKKKQAQTGIKVN